MEIIMFDALAPLFHSDNFMPHGHCFLWQPEVLWLHVLSDAMIGTAYFSIPLSIFYFARQRNDVPFRNILFLFRLFIVLCGTTHFFSIWVLWNPDYGPEGIVKLFTGLASVATAIMIWKIMPLALAMPSPAQLEAINAQLREGNTHIEHEVAKRSAELENANARFQESEAKLHQAQKMESIGNLTGGVAHDFNNLLGVVVGNLDLLLERIKNNAEAEKLTHAALGAALRGADLTRRLLAFARQQPLQQQAIDVNNLVNNLIQLLGRVLGEDVKISLNLGDDLWPVVADAAQLESALVNLAANARDAMPHGGQLIVSTYNGHLDADYASSNTDVTPGDYVVIAVSDTGIGMRSDIVTRIFEPFFTTKERDKGTGLGLSMVFGFMKQSGGHINVYSEIDEGTTFRLFLPHSPNGPVAKIDAPKAVGPAMRGHETILVVEDNEAVRTIVMRQLAELGYHVLAASDATAAMVVLASGKGVDLLFTDIVMPGQLNGLELARAAVERWPRLKVVLTSGFPETKLSGDGESAAGLRLLSKPYRKDELARVIYEVLASR
jgi:signal transduction histidine kinase